LDDDDGFTVYDYGDNPANTTQPYAPENIIIVSQPSSFGDLSLLTV
jgi:hypothetical protein